MYFDYHMKGNINEANLSHGFCEIRLYKSRSRYFAFHVLRIRYKKEDILLAAFISILIILP